MVSIRRVPGIAAAALLAAAMGPAAAQELPPQLGSYMPLYPGLYFTGGYVHDGGDSSYDQQGKKQPTATPQTPGGSTRLGNDSLLAQFTWHFPLFEAYQLPFVSSRTWLARATLRYSRTGTSGGLADYIASDAGQEQDLQDNSSGIGDVSLEYGTFLYGSADWRTSSSHPLAILALLGVDLPFGTYNHNAPNNPGSNTFALQGKLGLHWQPWSGGFVETGIGYRHYQIDEQPEFGQLAPRVQGPELRWDASLTQRVWHSLYLGGFYTQRRGSSDQYQNPQFAPNAPPPPPGSDDFPTPGTYRDGGTGLSTVAGALHYFITQRWLASLDYAVPIAGRSGQFTLPFTRSTPANCVPGALTCSEAADGAVLVDGMGPARSFASDVVTLSIRYNFGQGDAFSCANCKQ